VSFFGLSLRKIAASIVRPTQIPTAIALAVVVISGVIAERHTSSVAEQSLRAAVHSRISLIRSQIQGRVSGELQLVRGLAATIATEPDMDQARFSALSESLISDGAILRHVAAARGFVVAMIHPLQGNERALGLDYRNNETQKTAVERARDSRQLVLAGPVELVQGGQGLVGRFPIFVGRDRQFWGILSAVLDVPALYRASGIDDATADLEIALTGKDGMGVKGVTFFGSAGLLQRDPIVVDIPLPGGIWQLAALPRTGWNASGGNWQLRALILLAGVVLIAPIAAAGRLIEERQSHIRTLHSRERELQRLSRRLGLALETSRVGVWEYDIDSGDLFWDDRMNEIYGLPIDRGARSYNDWSARLHPDDLERARQDFVQAITETGSYHSEYRVVTPGGEVRSIRAIGSVYKDPDTTPKIIGVNWDVSADMALNDDLKRAKTLAEARNAELEAAKVQIEYNALHDSLTGLPNRRYLDEMLRREAVACAESGASIALLHIDLDRFKQINDTLGHAAGDAMLIHAAKVLSSNLRREDFVARIGGDEFVLLCRDASNAELVTLAGRIIAQMRQPVAFQGHECRFGVSVGIARETGRQVDANHMLVNADIALYRAKNRGRNRFEFFSDALQAEVVSTKRLADEILKGIEADEFIAYYQPQFDARTLDVVGVEALARWRHPSQGLLAPDAFLHIAEDINVVATIDRLILEQTLGHLRHWNASNQLVPRASVNVSSRRLHDEDLIANLQQLDIPWGTISFELVESIYLDESDEIVGWNIDRIKDLGIDVEIDDFGTGYASIVSLLKLKPRRLKIDRQLVMPIVASPAQSNLVASIIEIGKSLGVEVVAEGVETMEHARMLRDLGCDILQGYAFSGAISAIELDSFLRAQRWRAA